MNSRETGRPDVVVVGAGVAGLACARDLADGGLRVAVLEKARGVGGRLATRRVDGFPVDFGAVFLHGSDPEFWEAIETSGEATRPVAGWPARVLGSGPPCQPDAFRPGERRYALAAGVSAFPKRLAKGLDVRTGARAVALAAARGAIEVGLEHGESVAAETVVVALPAEQARELLAGLGGVSAGVLAAEALLEGVASLPSLTVLAGYPADAPAPSWDVSYPEDSALLQTASHESAKRPGAGGPVLVFQARPRWSREHLEQDPGAWGAAILAEAARLHGAWAGAPSWRQTHRWRYARIDRGNEFSAPLLVGAGDGARLGIAGEAFSPGGGVEAAWRSGRSLARRILEGGRT